LSKTKSISSSYEKKNAVGSLRWMAPEVLREKNYSEQSDVYSLGMIIWEIAAKCTIPFKDIDDKLVGFRIINGEKERIPSCTPKNIYDIIVKCWKDNPEERIVLVDILEVIKNTISSDSKIQEGQKESYSAELSSGNINWNQWEQEQLQAQIQIPPKQN
jgi:serine/threonine protein kinase